MTTLRGPAGSVEARLAAERDPGQRPGANTGSAPRALRPLAVL